MIMRLLVYCIVSLLTFCTAVLGWDTNAGDESLVLDSISPGDTLWIDSVATHSGEKIVLNINLVNPDSINGVDVPLRYFYPDFLIDSISFAGSRIEGVFSMFGANVDTAHATVHLYALQMSGTSLPPGRGLLARLHITVPEEYPTRVISFDSTFIFPVSKLTFVSRYSKSFIPQFRKGFVSNTYSPALNDSVWVDTVTVSAGEHFAVAVHGKNEQPLSSIRVPLTYHSDNIVFDSARISGTRSSAAVMFDALNNSGNRQLLLAIGFSESLLLPVGSGPVAMLYFTCQPGGSSTQVVLDTTTISTVGLQFVLGAVFNHIISFPDFSRGLVNIQPASDVDDNGPALPAAFALEQNYPNPFNPTTAIAFALPRASQVTLEVYNVLGQKVRTLVDGMHQAGYYSVVFDGRDDARKELASGVYLYRLRTDTDTQTHKMILQK